MRLDLKNPIPDDGLCGIKGCDGKAVGSAQIAREVHQEPDHEGDAWVALSIRRWDIPLCREHADIVIDALRPKPDDGMLGVQETISFLVRNVVSDGD